MRTGILILMLFFVVVTIYASESDSTHHDEPMIDSSQTPNTSEAISGKQYSDSSSVTIQKEVANSAESILTHTTTDRNKREKEPNNNRLFHFALSVSSGISNAQIKSDGLMKYYFEPTSKIVNRMSAFYEINAEFYLGKYFAVSGGLLYTRLGQKTEKTEVYFEDNQFKHEFESSAKINYFGIPLFVKNGFRINHFNALLRYGITPLRLMRKDVSWVIDGQDVHEGRVPSVNMSWWDFHTNLGIEFGYWIGKNCMSILADYSRGVHSIASGIDGNATNWVQRFGLKYSRELY